MPTPVQREIRKGVVYFFSLILMTIGCDAFLHAVGLLRVGRWLGPIGLGLIIFSFVYSIRRRKVITSGRVSRYLLFHEFAAWTGSLLVLVHSGIHFNNLIAWSASIAMLVATGSGLTGKYLLKVSLLKLKEQKNALLTEGHSADEVEEQLLKQARIVDQLKQWRKVHFPITMTFAFLALYHIFGVFYYGAL